MKKIVDDTRLIFKCCSLYYQDQVGQKQICELLGLSRPTVSRMLKSGREQGIVKIEVVNPDNVIYGELEHQLEKKFHLNEVVIVDTEPLKHDTKYINSKIGHAALRFLSRTLTDKDYVGVSMGLTIQNVVRADCPIDEEIDCIFVPLVGGVNEGQGKLEIHANYLARAFAERFGGRFEQFFSPALFSRQEVLKGFLQENVNQRILRMYDRLDVIILGIGVLDEKHSTLIQSGYITREQMKVFSELGAVGDIALRYFDIEGNTENFEKFNERVAGIALPQMTKVPKRIGIAGGKQKAAPVLGAIRGGYINVLITDVACAERLLNYK